MPEALVSKLPARIAPAILLLLLSAPVAAAGTDTKTIKLPTAADGEVFYQFDSKTNLPLSASDDRAEVTGVALTFLPKKGGEPLRWAFYYGLQFKPGVKPKSILVLSENQPPVSLEVGDTGPVLDKGAWSATSQPKAVDKATWDSMIGNTPWYLQRKFVITYADGNVRTLHQLAVITPTMRLELLEKVSGQKLLAPAKPAGQ